MSISDVSIRRPVLAVMLIGSLVVLGWISLARLGVDLFPDIEFPYIAVTTTLDGASPETIESEVTDVIEEYVSTIAGLRQVRSTSTEGVSQVVLEFELDELVSEKSEDVRDKISRAVAELPPEADAPIVEKMDPDASPIMTLIVSGDADIGALTTYVDEKIVADLERLPGVGSAKILGGRIREMRIWLDIYQMRAFGVTPTDVRRALSQEHIELPGGRLESADGRREYIVKTNAEANKPDEFADIVVSFRAGTRPVRLGDIATIEDSLADERTVAYRNGEPSIALEIRRQSGKNTVEVAKAIKAYVEKNTGQFQYSITINVARDVSRFIESSINDVKTDLIIAIILVVLVTYLFVLNVKATIIVALAIPTSLVATFFALYLFDFTLNTLTLLALTVAIGLLVDDAIVVVESIQKHLEKGLSPLEAASIGTKKVWLAVMAGTASTLAVFVPIAFMTGIIGRFFLQYGLAIVFSVSVSLLVALTLTPMLASRFMVNTELRNPVLLRIEGFHQWLVGAYARSLDVAVKYRYLVIVFAFLTFVGGIMIAKQIPTGFTSNADRSEFIGQVEMPLGIGIEEVKKAAKDLSTALKTIEQVEYVLVTAGGDALQKINLLDFYVALTPKQSRDIGELSLMAEARKAIAKHMPTATKSSVSSVPWISGGGVSNSKMEYIVQGPDLQLISDYVGLLMTEMKASPLFSDVRSSYQEGKPEVRLMINRQRAGELGISARTIALDSQLMIGGADVGTFQANGRRYDVRARLALNHRDTLEDLQLMQFRGASGNLLDAGVLVDFETNTGPSQIDRVDRGRKISIYANPGNNVALGDSAAAFTELLLKHPLPQGMAIKVEGETRRMQDTITAISFAFVLAIIAVYMVLAVQFDSFGQPIIVMLTAPLCFSGAFAGLYLADQQLALFAQIGLIALMGIVMKNGILLVDRANQLRAEGMTRIEAIVLAGPERLRPVLMTALSAVLGMVPIAFATSDGAEWRNSMGFIIMGGLSSSTILTLFVIPAAYGIITDADRFRKKISLRFAK
ncbi:MAG: efflux RND transporter permease subunit [Kordiimonadaceae bacterium]|nr:efflux RND transporter permease subunit [Kordiimonadaceae bacterium]